jgi:hypothetical protein
MLVDLVVIWMFLRPIIIFTNQKLQQERHHSYMLMLVFVVLMVINQGQQPRGVLPYLQMPLLINYIINARYPGEWRDNSIGVVFPWQE